MNLIISNTKAFSIILFFYKNNICKYNYSKKILIDKKRIYFVNNINAKYLVSRLECMLYKMI